MSNANVEPRITEITLRFVVTEYRAHCLGEAEGVERAAIADAVRETVLYEEAKTVQVRDIRITIPLAPAPETATVSDSVAVEIPDDLREMIEKEIEQRRTQRRLDAVHDAWSIVGSALTPGTYEVYVEGNSRGLRRLDP